MSSRERAALEAARSFSGTDVARLLRDAGKRVDPRPAIITCSTGTECSSTAFDHWVD